MNNVLLIWILESDFETSNGVNQTLSKESLQTVFKTNF